MSKGKIIALILIILFVIFVIYGLIIGAMGTNQGKALCKNKGMEYVEKISTGFWTDDYICYSVLEDGEIKYYYYKGD